MSLSKKSNALIVNAKKIMSRYGAPIFPVQGKTPAVRNLKSYYDKKQTDRDIEILFRRKNATGIAIILTKLLHVLDLDGLKNIKSLREILKMLGLPINYEHVVKTGGGFHIYFYCIEDKNKLADLLGGNKDYYVLKFKEQFNAKQIELRWEECYVVGPYSKHPSGNIYTYCFGEPVHKPQEINVDNIINTLHYFCVLDEKKNASESTDDFNEEELQAVTNFLKHKKLGYQEWNKCKFALATFGELGKKYFLNMSINEFYPKDSEAYLNKEYSNALKYYKKEKIGIASLFFIAKKKGYKNDKWLSKEFLEFELCTLCYPEKKKEKHLEMILHYAIVKKALTSRGKKKTNNKLLEQIKKRLQISISTNSIIKDYELMGKHIASCIKNYGKEPYCRIGEDFFIETIWKKFDFMTFSILCAITAIQGKSSNLQIIGKDRMRAGMQGYKSSKIMKTKIANNKPISDYQIRRRVNRLKELKIIAQQTLYRVSYYSTFLSQEYLMKKVKERYLAKVKQKMEEKENEKKYIEEIKAEKAKLNLVKPKKVKSMLDNKNIKALRLLN